MAWRTLRPRVHQKTRVGIAWPEGGQQRCCRMGLGDEPRAGRRVLRIAAGEPSFISSTSRAEPLGRVPDSEDTQWSMELLPLRGHRLEHMGKATRSTRGRTDCPSGMGRARVLRTLPHALVLLLLQQEVRRQHMVAAIGGICTML